MKLLIIDGQGGGIGKALVERLKDKLPDHCQLTAVGTNAIATMAMMKAGASRVATGENAIVFHASKADVIAGSIGMIAANSLMGELSTAMAEAVSSSDAKKILIPLNRCGFQVAGLGEVSLPFILDDAIKMILEAVSEKGD